MTTIEKIKIILFVVPFIFVIFGAYFMDLLPKTNLLKRFFDAMIEKDVEKLMLANGMRKTSLVTFQRVRWLCALALGFTLMIVLKREVSKRLLISLLAIFAIYKFMYIYLRLLEAKRIAKMNELLPYTIKTLAYMTYIYPVSVAIRKSVDYIPKEFRYDLQVLYDDIYNDPNSKKPYTSFVDKYEHKLHMLEIYLDQIYRLDQSGIKHGEKQLETLNQKVSSEISRIRQMKNKRINNTVAYLGFIPVALMVVVLIYLLVSMSMATIIG